MSDFNCTGGLGVPSVSILTFNCLTFSLSGQDVLHKELWNNEIDKEWLCLKEASFWEGKNDSKISSVSYACKD